MPPAVEPRTAIVTGAGSGLGRAIALELAREGWEVALVDIERDAAEETLDLVQNVGGRGRVELGDVSQLAVWQELVERLQADWPQLDLLVNNAGVCGSGVVGEFPIEDWQWLLDVNLYGAIYGCHVMVDWLKANPRGGHIINVASVAAFASAAAMAAYNVSKAGVVALSETLHAELSPQVGVTVVCPGFVPTQLLCSGRFSCQEHRDSAEWYTRRSWLTAEGVAKVAMHAMRRRRLYAVTGLRARIVWRLKRWWPGLFMRLIASGYQIESRRNKKKAGIR